MSVGQNSHPPKEKEHDKEDTKMKYYKNDTIISKEAHISVENGLLKIVYI